MDVGFAFGLGFGIGVCAAGTVFHVLLRRLDKRIDDIQAPRAEVFKGLVMYGVELNRYTHDPDEIDRKANEFVAHLLSDDEEFVPTSS